MSYLRFIVKEARERRKRCMVSFTGSGKLLVIDDKNNEVPELSEHLKALFRSDALE